MDTIRDKFKPHVVRALSWGVLGLAFTLFQLLLGVGLTGVGHGVGTPLLISGAPFGLFFFLWPVVFFLAGWGGRWASSIVIILMLGHCGGVVFIPDIWLQFIKDFQRESIRFDYLVWLLLYLMGNLVLVVNVFTSFHSLMDRFNGAGGRASVVPRIGK